MLKVVNYNVNSKNELTIAHFSDIHYSYKFKTKVFKEILDKLNELKPDYICITGDIVDNIEIGANEKVMEPLYKFIEELSSITKVIITLGNHDIREYKGKIDNKWYLSLKKMKNIIFLNNEFYTENDLCFYGFTASEEYYHNERDQMLKLKEELVNIRFNKKKTNILLIHSPIHLGNEKMYENIKDFNLILCGHTHNGLMPHFIKGNFGIVAPNHKLFLKNARKSFKNKNITIIISGGITKLSSGTKFLHFFDKFFKSDINYIKLK